MKPQELRVGNLVLFDKNIEIVSMIGKNVDYYKGYSLKFESGNSVTMEFDIAPLKPILITEDWFVSLGFNLIHKENRHYSIKHPNGFKDSFQIHFFETIGDMWHLAFSDSNSSKDYIPATHIKYVHQLQNLYFALTNEELINEFNYERRTKKSK